MIGGSYRGSPTAISFLQLKREIGSKLWGSSICEHSSRIIILNCMFFMHSKPVAAHVAPTTRFDFRASSLVCRLFWCIYSMQFYIDLASSNWATVICPLGPQVDSISLSMFLSSLIASLSAFFLFEEEVWVKGRSFLSIFFSEPTLAKSLKPCSFRVRRILSTATFVKAHTNILVSVSCI